MKKTVALLCTMLCTMLSFAQERDIKAIEVEIGAGMTFGASKLKNAGFDKTKIGETGFVEIRYNFKQAPVDLGLHIGGTIFGRTIKDTGEKLNFSSGNFMVTSDYNFRFWNPNYTVFAGLGVGVAKFGNSAQTEYRGDGIYVDNGTNSSVCFMPRVGVELWQHLRLTMSYVIEERANSHFNLTIGVAIGGGCKKHRQENELY